MAKKMCGNCRWFSYIDGSTDARNYPTGGDWGWCFAPVPMSVGNSRGRTILATDRAKECPIYKRKAQ